MILTKVVWVVTTLEKWSGRKNLFKHFQMFECMAWDHILNDERNNLDAKTHACIMI